MKKTLYVIKNLGFGKSTLYLALYPLRFFRGAIKKLDDIHDEMRWHRQVYTYYQKNAHSTIKDANNDVLKLYKRKFGVFNESINFDWIRLFNHHSDEKGFYISVDLYYRVIEPVLNKLNNQMFFTDKNNYSFILESFKQPHTIIRFINFRYYDADYNILSDTEAESLLISYPKPYIIKPSVESGGGKNILKAKNKRGKIQTGSGLLTLNFLSETYTNGFIIQEILSQSQLLAKFHPFSLNTFRVITLRLGREIHLLSALIKFGVGGSFIDNASNGGIWCGIDKDGKLCPYGYTNKFEKLYKHPDTDKQFGNTRLRFYKKVTSMAVNMHKYLLNFDIVSWDIAVNKQEEPVLIEYNLRYQSIVNHQTANGPLFGDLTDDVLAEVVRRRNRYRA